MDSFIFGERGEFIAFDKLPYLTEGARLLFLGASGAGKSNFLLLFTEWAVKNNIRVVFIDVNGGESSGELPAFIQDSAAPSKYIDLHEYVEGGDGTQVVNMVSKYLFRARKTKEPHFLVIDDVDYLAAKSPIFDWQKETARMMSHLIYNARKWGVNTVSASNAASRVLPYWVEQQNIRFIGMTTSRKDWAVHKVYLPSDFTLNRLINLSAGEVYISSKRMSPSTIQIIKSSLGQGGDTPAWKTQ